MNGIGQDLRFGCWAEVVEGLQASFPFSGRLRRVGVRLAPGTGSPTSTTHSLGESWL